jgi:hypothetical protein
MNIGEFFENRLESHFPEVLRYEPGGYEKSDKLYQKDMNKQEFEVIPFEEILLILTEVRPYRMRMDSSTIKIIGIDGLVVCFKYDYLRYRGVGKDEAWEIFTGKFDFKTLKILELLNETNY